MSIGIDSHNLTSINVNIRPQSAGLHSQRKTAVPKFGIFICQCPATKINIESGIEMDQRTYQKIGDLDVRIYCPACHSLHVVKVANGSLTPTG